MKTKSLYKLLEILHEELAKLQTIDRDVRHRLIQIQKDIERLINRKKVVTAHHRHSLIKKLNMMVNDFEKTHPELTETLGQMMDSLSRMGI